MKLKTLLSVALVAALSSAGLSAKTLSQSQVTSIQRTLSATPLLELVPKAAEMVKQTRAEDQEAVAVTVVRAVLAKRATLAAAIVEAIAKVAPSTSLAIATAAVELCPQQAEQIAKAASFQSPAQAQEIGVAVAKTAPAAALKVTRMAVAANPDASPEIVEAIVKAVPSAETAIYSNPTLAVVQTMARLTRSSASAPVPKLVFSKPNKTPPVGPAVKVDTFEKQDRSAEVNQVLQKLNDVGDKLATKDAAKVNISIVSTLNKITTNQSKEDRGPIITAMSDTLTQVSDAKELSSEDIADAMQSAAGVIGTIVEDKDLTPDVVLTFVNFTKDKVKELIEDTGLTTGKAKGAVIKEAAGEVAKVISAVQNITPAQAQEALEAVKQKIEEKRDEYATP